MGFFLTEAVAAQLEAPKKVSQPRAPKNTDLMPTERGCDLCPLQEIWPRISTPQMPMSGALDGDVLVLGEAPGEQEDIEGQAFVGDSGKLLHKHVPLRWLERIAFSNTARCRPPGNRNPTGLESHCCSIHLENDIETSNFKAILGIGSVPLSRFVTEAPITHIHGTRFVVELGGKLLWYYPVFHPSFLLHQGGTQSSAYPVFTNDLSNFFKNVDKWRAPRVERPKPENVICVYDEQQAYDLYAKLKPLIGVDLETTGLRCMERDARLLTGALSDGDLTMAFPVDHPESPNAWGLKLLLKASSEHVWVAHNAAFELAWLMFMAEQAGIKWTPERFEDSMALARIYHSRETLLDLGVQSRIHLGVNVKKFTRINVRNMISHTLAETLPYNGLDAWASVKIYPLLAKRVDSYNYEHILGAVKSTTRMELAGLPYDHDASLALKEEWEQKSSAAQEKARTLYEVRAYERETQIEFNIGSNDQVAAALTTYGKIQLPKTGSGKHFSTDDATLQSVAGDNPLAKCTLEYREAQKQVSTYIDPYLRAKQRFVDGLIHPSYSTMLVSTLRLSSVDPNIQNQPKRRHRELRRQVVAPLGHALFAFDQGQLEARVYAMACKDPALCASIIAKEDIHSYWLRRVLDEYPDYIHRLAVKVNQTDEAKIIKAGRDIIKTDFVFASLFGTSARNCAERTEIPFLIMQELLDMFWARYPLGKKWLTNQRKEYYNTGGVRTLTNRLRYGILPGMEPLNTPIQGTGADLVIDAQNDLSEMAIEVDDFYLHPRINIHDDLTFILPTDNEDRLETYINTIAGVMTKVRFPWQIVPLTVEVKMGHNWCDMEEIAVITGDYVR